MRVGLGKIVPVRNAVSFGKNVLLNRSQLAVKMQIKKTLTFNRKIYSNAVLWKGKANYSSIINGNTQLKEKSQRFFNRTVKLTVKLIVLTSLTLVVGTIIASTYNKKQEENVDSDGSATKKTNKIKITGNSWILFCYSTLPLNAVSRLWGQFNKLSLPVWFRPYGYKFYSFLFGVDLNEMADPNLKHYANLSEFFYRDIKPETRPIAQGNNVIASPSDGKILQMGIIDLECGAIEQVKGMTYSLQEFLGSHAEVSSLEDEQKLKLKATINDNEILDKKKGSNYQVEADRGVKVESEGDAVLNEALPSNSKILKLLKQVSSNYKLLGSNEKDASTSKLYYTVIYLAPGDYHHFHSPIDWVCEVRRHFPGALFSVAPYFQKNFPKLFILNERVALLGNWKHGFFSMTAVGATNVGSIKLNFDKELITNKKRLKLVQPKTCYEASYSSSSKVLGGYPLVKGDDMGGFELGSTVVLCFEAPDNFAFDIKLGDIVKMGQQLGSAESKKN